MAERSRSKPERQTRIGKERIALLLKKAGEASTERALADRHAAVARKIAMRFNIRLERAQKRRICPHCHSYLSPGRCTVRTSATRQAVVATCAVCGRSKRLPYAREKAAAKRKRVENRKAKL